MYIGAYADGLVAFKLDSLPDTNGKTVKLKLKWKSFDGDKSVEFNYCSRKSTPAKASIAAVEKRLKFEIGRFDRLNRWGFGRE